MSDFDSPWKEALERFLPLFLEFFFPEIHADIDWSRGWESLDKELQQVVHDAEMGPRLADKLFRVWRRDGLEAWVLIHIEIQSQPDEEFAERMYVYNYRLYDRFRRPIVSLAVLGDTRASWRPAHFGYELWGCKISMDFPIVKLLDYGRDLGALEAAVNPFGLIVLAHLQTVATAGDQNSRKVWKVRVVKGLLDRGLDADTIRQLFRLIDWMMDLPTELEREFSEEIRQYEEEKMKPYVTSIERLGIEKGLEQGLAQGRQEGRQEGRHEGRQEGRQEGREEGEAIGLRDAIALALELRFGPAGLQLQPEVEKVRDLKVLRKVRQGVRSAATVEDVRALLAQIVG